MVALYQEKVTLCLTMGGRPDLLRESLESLCKQWKFKKVVAVNDFSDPECDAVFKELFPEGVLLSDQEKRGHHGAVDWLYKNVDTEFVLHTEDDWVFREGVRLDLVQNFLSQHPVAVSYCFRHINSFLPEKLLNEAKIKVHCGVPYYDISQLHPQWYSYSFNPHLIRTEQLRKIGSFQNYKKERHISLAMKKKGFFVAYAAEPFCEHIGDGRSLANPNANKPSSAVKRWIKGVLGQRR